MHLAADYPKDEYEKPIVGSGKCMDRRHATPPGAGAGEGHEACRAVAIIAAM